MTKLNLIKKTRYLIIGDASRIRSCLSLRSSFSFRCFFRRKRKLLARMYAERVVRSNATITITLPLLQNYTIYVNGNREPNIRPAFSCITREIRAVSWTVHGRIPTDEHNVCSRSLLAEEGGAKGESDLSTPRDPTRGN
jgi:hypothetical protein